MAPFWQSPEPITLGVNSNKYISERPDMEHKSYNQSVVKQAGGSCRVGKDDKCAQLSRIQCIRYVPQRQMESTLTYHTTWPKLSTMIGGEQKYYNIK